ncbi:hypothetical protein K040078D81_45460 [Blautia hominis]|uniref:Uncharacterized protein n=1 Tax=Blautia hominis TaxID=2025493 RepID=A0ABQ0BG39_9FIRM
MGLQIDELIDYIGLPVWDAKKEEWLVISEVSFSHLTVHVYGTDGSVREFPRELDATWLHESEV